MSGTFMVSLDFELFWGMLEVCPLEEYRDNVLGGRKAIPALLDLFQKYGIHATWATVGFLFADNKQDAAAYFPEHRPTYENPELDPYQWFHKIGDDEKTAPCFFCPSLIKLVADTPGQEIGSHSFCHYYCWEKGQTAQQFREDMAAARKIAAAKGYEVTSAILPRNQCVPQYIEILKDLGYTAFRDEEEDWIHQKLPFNTFRRGLQLLDIYLPLTGWAGGETRKENGIWIFDGTRMYKAIRPGLHFLEGLKLHRIKAQMRWAAKHGGTFHLWWHPHNLGVRTREHLAQLEEIFRYYQQLKEKYGMECLNMGEVVREKERG